MALTSKAAAERKPKTVSALALEIAYSHLAQARASRASLSAPERLRRLRASLREKLDDIDPATDAHAHVVWTQRFSGVSVEAVAFDTAPGITVPLF